MSTRETEQTTNPPPDQRERSEFRRVVVNRSIVLFGIAGAGLGLAFTSAEIPHAVRAAGPYLWAGGTLGAIFNLVAHSTTHE